MPIDVINNNTVGDDLCKIIRDSHLCQFDYERISDRIYQRYVMMMEESEWSKGREEEPSFAGEMPMNLGRAFTRCDCMSMRKDSVRVKKDLSRT